jgi:hypothetical protein
MGIAQRMDLGRWPALGAADRLVAIALSASRMLMGSNDARIDGLPLDVWLTTLEPFKERVTDTCGRPPIEATIGGLPMTEYRDASRVSWAPVSARLGLEWAFIGVTDGIKAANRANAVDHSCHSCQNERISCQFDWTEFGPADS